MLDKVGVLLALAFVASAEDLSSISEIIDQAVFVSPSSFAVLGPNATFRTNAFNTSTFFNPTSTSPPFFQIFDPAFLSILGPNASVHEVSRNDTFAFAHEAPVYNPATDEIFFCSNGGGTLGLSDIDHNNVVNKISLKEVEKALAENNGNGSVVHVPYTTLDLPDSLQMTNGGTGPYNSSLIFTTQGRGSLPPSLVLVNPAEPYNATVLLDNFFGRQFNSLNDVKVHPTSGKLYFTDVRYGWLNPNTFRGEPLLPSHVYMLDPETRAVRVVADGFDKPNGIAFSPDGKTAYITDTGALGAQFGNNQTEPA
ncbi:hypothetical protein D9758_010732 [Tetrapyrgos nigripes]|uniref:SMP-30/Gluconolactonase/LRE-like region domain-containing protein n=1 Tax=Tetrapyrgos nigripes TaxID=182062 RepID=A0A8H5D6C0_9AGAR|nr:hypothetical protein D9758_010732 [Tetrapyrgos nigripes]